MVAAPSLGVVFDDDGIDDACDALPGGPVAFVVADDEVGSVVFVGPGIDGVPVIDADDGQGTARRTVREGGELSSELGFQGRSLRSRRDLSLRLPALEVEIDAAKTQGVSLRPGPVDVLEPFAAFRPGGEKPEVSVLMEPGVEVDAAPEGLETVVGHDE